MDKPYKTEQLLVIALVPKTCVAVYFSAKCVWKKNVQILKLGHWYTYNRNFTETFRKLTFCMNLILMNGVSDGGLTWVRFRLDPLTLAYVKWNPKLVPRRLRGWDNAVQLMITTKTQLGGMVSFVRWDTGPIHISFIFVLLIHHDLRISKNENSWRTKSVHSFKYIPACRYLKPLEFRFCS